jgi:hypothetical protein
MAAVTGFQSGQRISSAPVTGYRYVDGEVASEAPQLNTPVEDRKKFSPSSLLAVGIAFLAGGGLLAGAAVIMSKLISVGSGFFGGL